MDLKDLNTSKMVYDPNDKDFISRIEKIPGFKEFKHKDRKKIFQYIALMYDINTPMVSEYGDYWERKKICAEICKLKKSSNGKFNEESEKILLNAHETISPLVVIFVTSFASSDYMQLVFSWEMRFKVMKDSFNSETPDRNYVETMRKLNEDIKDCTRLVFESGDYDEFSEIRKLLYKSADLKRLNRRPEDIAKKLQEDFAFGSPYGDYKPSKMIFLGDSEETAKKKLNERR